MITTDLLELATCRVLSFRTRPEESIQIDVLLEGRCAGNGRISLHKLEAQFLHGPAGSRIIGERFAPESLQDEPIQVERDGLPAELIKTMLAIRLLTLFYS
jgi:hypothetical protein